MDKSLKNPLIWLLCGVVIFLVIFAYARVKSRSGNIPEPYLSWTETVGIIKEVTPIDSVNIRCSVEYTDAQGAPRQVEILSRSRANRTGSRTKIFYNPEQFSEAVFSEDIINP
jgi:hypothetical protein